jgi:nitrate/TMAO reductase-like tetraheme cytochrome c subunit
MRTRIGHLAGLAAAFVALWTLTLAGAPALGQSPPATPSPNPDTASECVGCHALPGITVADDGRYRPGLYVTADALKGSVHADFTCVTCHSALTANMHARRDAARESCHTCHQQQYDAYEAGYHGSKGTEGPKPTCITCHGNHDVQDPETRDFVHRASEQCARCHSEMNERFQSGNAFGMDTHLAGEDVATCVDCHSYHLVLPASDPRSPVNKANILTTCRKCHTNAPPNFADVELHLAQVPIPNDPRLRIVTIYMLTLLIGTFAFFGYLTVLGIRHEWRRVNRRNDAPVL